MVQQALLNNETDGIWLFASPNPQSFFWTFAALGYGFMGISLLFAAATLYGKADRATKGLFIANGLIGIAFLAGNAAGIITINILSSFIWGTIFPVTTILVARTNQKATRNIKHPTGYGSKITGTPRKAKPSSEDGPDRI